MKKLLTLFIGLFSIISFGNCSNETLTITLTGNITSNITTTERYRSHIMPIFQNENFTNKNVEITLNNVKINGNEVNFGTPNNEGIYITDLRTYVIKEQTTNSEPGIRITTGSNTFIIKGTTYKGISSVGIKYRKDNGTITCNSTTDPCIIEMNITIEYDKDINFCNILNNGNNNCENELMTCQNSLNNLSGDLLQCQEDLINCGEGNTPSCESGNIQWSSLFINDIQHESASNINITIPEEIGRDYTNEDDEFDLTVNGYNVDEDYIAQIIENEKMTPTADDFSYLIENLGDYIPLLCIAGLMVTARYIIKKVF